MKKLYIPKGVTRHYEYLESENIIVEGCLKVEGIIKARHISGHGIIEAGAISTRTITAMDIDSAHIVAEELMAERVCAAEVHISGAALVSCRLESQLVEADKLTLNDCDIGELRCDNVVNLPAKHRSLLGTLLASSLRSLWCSWFRRVPKDGKNQTMDTDWKPQSGREQPASQPIPEAPAAQVSQPAPEDNASFGAAYQDLEDDFEFKRLAALYRLNKGKGFYLRLFPLEASSELPAEPPFPEEAVWPAA